MKRRFLIEIEDVPKEIFVEEIGEEIVKMLSRKKMGKGITAHRLRGEESEDQELINKITDKAREEIKSKISGESCAYSGINEFNIHFMNLESEGGFYQFSFRSSDGKMREYVRFNQDEDYDDYKEAFSDDANHIFLGRDEIIEEMIKEFSAKELSNVLLELLENIEV